MAIPCVRELCCDSLARALCGEVHCHAGSVEGRGDLLGWGAAAIRGLFGDG